MMLRAPEEDDVVPGYWCNQTMRWIPTHRVETMIDLPTTTDYKPSEVTALEYLRGVSRALKTAGLTANVGHIDTAVNKLINEQEIPKVRLLQILNKLQESVDKEQKDITLSVDELRTILSSNRFKV